MTALSGWWNDLWQGTSGYVPDATQGIDLNPILQRWNKLPPLDNSHAMSVLNQAAGWIAGAVAAGDAAGLPGQQKRLDVAANVDAAEQVASQGELLALYPDQAGLRAVVTQAIIETNGVSAGLDGLDAAIAGLESDLEKIPANIIGGAAAAGKDAGAGLDELVTILKYVAGGIGVIGLVGVVVYAATRK